MRIVKWLISVWQSTGDYITQVKQNNKLPADSWRLSQLVTGLPKSNKGKEKVDKLLEVKQNPNQIAT